jgi:transcriptional regulator with XRE-family HTH domain
MRGQFSVYLTICYVYNKLLPMKSISQQLKQIIDASGMSRYRICKETGLAESSMSKFMAGERALSLETVDQIGLLLKLELTAQKGRTVNRGKSVK